MKWIQRVLGLAVLCLFILSVLPAVLAEENENRNSEINEDESQENNEITTTGFDVDTESENRESDDSNVRQRVREDLREDTRAVVDTAKERMKERTDEYVSEVKSEARERGEELVDEVKIRAKEEFKEGKTKIKQEARKRIRKALSDDDKVKFREAEDNYKKFRMRVKEVNEKYKEIKEQHQEKREAYKNYKEEFSRIKEEAKRCDSEAEDCQTKKNELKRGVKNHLIKTNDVIYASLQKLQNRIEGADGLSDEDKKEAQEKLAALEDRLTTQAESVTALSEEATSEELRVAIQELKSLWQDVRKEQRSIIASLLRAKEDRVVERHDSLSDKMLLKIEKLQERGVDTAKLESIVERYQTHVIEIHNEHDKVSECWKEATEDVGRKECKEDQKKFKESLADSRDILKEFVSTYKDVRTTT